MKPNLKEVTLVSIDTTDKSYLAERAIMLSLEQCDFGSVKLLTNRDDLQYAVKIPALECMEGYSTFCIRELHKHIQTSHCLLVQADGYVLNGQAWRPEFLQYDYIGAPWGGRNLVGNGGFSLRSKRLLESCANPKFTDNPHPEDDFICRRHRSDLENMGNKFCPKDLADIFAVEGASFIWADYSWNSDGRHYDGHQFGFHSWLTPLPGVKDRPLVFHHSGDLGDIIYSLPVMKALGGGVLFVSSDCRYPFPGRPRVKLDHPGSNLFTPFLERQSYVWKAKYTPETPHSTDVDLNAFRLAYAERRTENFKSLFHLHLDAYGLDYPEDEPWLESGGPIEVPGRPILVNRTPRYRNEHFPWSAMVRQYGERMAFVGLPPEYEQFRHFGEPFGIKVPFIQTDTIDELAMYLAGAKVFIGNQSSPMAIALGLGKNIIQECWQGNSNCLFRRKNCIYFGVTTTDPKLGIPEEWL